MKRGVIFVTSEDTSKLDGRHYTFERILAQRIAEIPAGAKVVSSSLTTTVTKPSHQGCGDSPTILQAALIIWENQTEQTP